MGAQATLEPNKSHTKVQGLQEHKYTQELNKESYFRAGGL
jgi:hypothetical protein